MRSQVPGAEDSGELVASKDDLVKTQDVLDRTVSLIPVDEGPSHSGVTLTGEKRVDSSVGVTCVRKTQECGPDGALASLYPETTDQAPDKTEGSTEGQTMTVGTNQLEAANRFHDEMDMMINVELDDGLEEDSLLDKDGQRVIDDQMLRVDSGQVNIGPEVDLDILSKVAASMSEEETVRLRDRLMEDVCWTLI